MFQREFEFAAEAVRRASELVRAVQREMVSPALTKNDRSPVTIGDYTAQAVVAAMLQQHFPDDPLVAEEASGLLRQNDAQLQQVVGYVRRFDPRADIRQVCDWIDRGAAAPGPRFWTLDPIDGTKGFLRGEQYAVALALIVEGRVRLGVIGCPHLSPAGVPDEGGAVFFAVEGGGAWSEPMALGPRTALRVSPCHNPCEARILRSLESGHTNVAQIDRFTTALGAKGQPVRMDSLAKYAVLSAGGAEIMVRLISADRPDYKECIWDQAAGMLVAQEAGGRVTDLDGRPLDFSAGRRLLHNRGVLASNGQLHEAALAALRAIGA